MTVVTDRIEKSVVLRAPPSRVWCALTDADEADDGTRLTVVESGFDALPPELREQAFRENEGGWEIQMGNVREHVDG